MQSRVEVDKTQRVRPAAAELAAAERTLLARAWTWMRTQLSLGRSQGAGPAPRSPRDARLSAVLRVQYRSAGHMLVSYSTNLSRGGLFVTSATPLPIGTPLDLQVSLPGHAAPTIQRAVVRWVRATSDASGPAGMGLEFESASPVFDAAVDSMAADFSAFRVAVLHASGTKPLDAIERLRTLLRSEVSLHVARDQSVSPPLQPRLDLVVFDLSNGAGAVLPTAEALARGDFDVPRVLIVPERSEELARGVAKLGRIVRTPISADEFDPVVLAAIADVAAQAPSAGAPRDDT